MRCLYTDDGGGRWQQQVFYSTDAGDVYCLQQAPPGFLTRAYMYPAPDLDTLLEVYGGDKKTIMFESVEALLDWLTQQDKSANIISIIYQWLV